ncbi:MAG TPA: NAD(P)-dependent oxidoreductase [Bordetella sp.]
MTTLITGGSGSVGLALAEHLLAAGDAVVGYDLAPPSAAAAQTFAALPGRFVAVRGDARDEAALCEAMRAHGVRHVVLMAAITANARRERAMPRQIFDVNVGGVLAGLAAAAQCGVQRVLYASSGAVYGASGRDAVRDEASSALLPEGLYGMSKRAAEEAARRYSNLAGLPLVIGRLGTCFGPWEADSGMRDTLSPPLQVARLAWQGREVVLPRDSRRDWLYVRDAASAIVGLLHADWRHEVYNLAAGHEWNMSQWCDRLAAKQPGFAWRYASQGDPANVDYWSDYDRGSMRISRLLADTSFVPAYDLAAAFDDFQSWIAAHGAAYLGGRAG